MTDDMRPVDRRPIFVLGMLQRSGTNFLRDLLTAHPACGGTEVLAEDFLLHHAELLDQYCGWVQGHWAEPLFPDEVKRLRGELFRHLGRGVLEFVRETVDAAERPVLKTPSVRNLDLFSGLFGEVALLVIVRDGRALVESGMRSFDWNFEEAVRRWAEAADAVLRFKRQVDGRDIAWKLVRYEDLVTDLRGELSAVFAAVGLDPRPYDFEAAEALPVRGSSTLRGGRDEVHWEPVDRRPDFRPLQRWAGWNRARHERFNWLAGDQLRALGYEPEEFSDHTKRWAAWNHGRDARWLAGRFRGKLARTLRTSIRRLNRRTEGL